MNAIANKISKAHKVFVPTERQTIEWEQEDVLFDMLDATKDWMTIDEMLAWGPEARSVQHHVLPTGPISPRAMRTRIMGMVKKGVVLARVRQMAAGYCGMAPYEYRLWEPEPC